MMRSLMAMGRRNCWESERGLGHLERTLAKRKVLFLPICTFLVVPEKGIVPYDVVLEKGIVPYRVVLEKGIIPCITYIIRKILLR